MWAELIIVQTIDHDFLSRDLTLFSCHQRQIHHLLFRAKWLPVHFVFNAAWYSNASVFSRNIVLCAWMHEMPLKHRCVSHLQVI